MLYWLYGFERRETSSNRYRYNPTDTLKLNKRIYTNGANAIINNGGVYLSSILKQ